MGLRTIKTYLKQKILSVKPNSQYNFLIKKLEKTLDLDLAIKVMATDYYKENLVIQEVNLNQFDKVTVIAPHQDDEVIGCGGLLSALKNQNKKIDLIFLTDGRPSTKEYQSMVNTRNKEALEVGGKLGADVYFIDVDNVSLDFKEEHFAKLKNILDINNSTIFMPWALDAPPKHRLCNAFINEFFKKVKLPNYKQLFNYQVHTSLVPNLYFDYTSIKDEKKYLIDIYKSQLEYQNYKHLSLSLDGWNSRLLGWSKQPKFIEVFQQIPFIEWNKWIEMYKVDVQATFKGDPNCIKSFNDLMNLSKSL
ncbi:MAG: PIG-L deacetylase family protein [Bacteroidota bacterium]